MADMTHVMTRPKVEYEIRFHHRDATLTMVMMISAASDEEARAKARKMLKGEVCNANIWRVGRLIDSFSAIRNETAGPARSPIKLVPRTTGTKSHRARRTQVVDFAPRLAKKAAGRELEL